MIIDDHSNTKYATFEIEDPYVSFIKSDLPPGRGEILPYYYMYRDKLFEKAIIIHDGVFIQKEVQIPDADFKFLWNSHFPDMYDKNTFNVDIYVNLADEYAPSQFFKAHKVLPGIRRDFGFDNASVRKLTQLTEFTKLFPYVII